VSIILDDIIGVSMTIYIYLDSLSCYSYESDATVQEGFHPHPGSNLL